MDADYQKPNYEDNEALRVWPDLPENVADADVPAFIRWLERGGVQVVKSHLNERLVHLLEPPSWGAIDRVTRDGRLRWIGTAPQLYSAFLVGHQLTPARPLDDFLKKEIIAYLRRRDCDDCWYCGQPVARADETLEHLLSRTCGGGNHPSNLALAHYDCNWRAGSLPLAMKIALREKLRAEAGNDG